MFLTNKFFFSWFRAQKWSPSFMVFRYIPFWMFLKTSVACFVVVLILHNSHSSNLCAQSFFKQQNSFMLQIPSILFRCTFFPCNTCLSLLLKGVWKRSLLMLRSGYTDSLLAGSLLPEAEANVITLFVLPCWAQTLQLKFHQMFQSRATLH